MQKRNALIAVVLSLMPLVQPLIIGSTVAVFASTSKAYAGVKEDILSNMDRAFESSSSDNHKDAIKYATKVINLLPKIGPEMKESEFAMYMYDVRAYSKYSIDDNKGACKDWEKAASISEILGEGFETNAS